MSTPRPQKPKRRWLRYSLRSLLILVTAICVATAYVAPIERTKRAVAIIEDAGGVVQYDYQVNGEDMPRPEWVAERFGLEYVASPVYARLARGATDAEIQAASHLTTLRELDCAEAPLTDSHLSLFSGHRELRILDLRGSRITDAGLQYLEHMQHLETIQLFNTAIGDDGAARLARLPTLRVVGLCETRITDNAMRPLASLPALYSLDIDFTSVTDAGLFELTSCKTVEFIYAANNAGVTTGSKVMLRRMLPRCFVDDCVIFRSPD